MSAADVARGKDLARNGIHAPGPSVAEVPWPDEPPPDAEHQGDDEEPEATTWEPVDLGPYLRGDFVRPEPTIGAIRSDGQRFIYPGREHSVLGETESGKTWLALACVAAELVRGNRVVYLHYEESDPGSTIERLRLLGVTAEDITDRLRFAAPSRPVRSEWLSALLDPAPVLVVHDGVNEAMSLHGADIMAADGASSFRRRLIMPCLRAGAATLACDHLPKNIEGRGRDAYGSVHKGNAIDGARFVIENTKPFGRGLRGVSYVFVTKDRPGQLRAQGKPSSIPGKTFFGTLVVDADLASSADFRLGLYPPADDDAPKSGNTAADNADAVHAVIDGLPKNTVASMRLLYAEMRKAGHTLRDSAIRSAVDDLIVDGRVLEVPGRRGARGYKTVTDCGPATPADSDRVPICVPTPPTGGGTQSDAVAVTASDAVGRSGTQSKKLQPKTPNTSTTPEGTNE